MAHVVNPPLPFTTQINGFGHGTRLEINGTTWHHSNRFEINLKSHSGMHLLHFNPRFDQNVVVLNHNLHGSWGTELRPGPFPAHKGTPFSIHIIAEHGRIDIKVNGQHFASYHENHHMFHEIRLIEIKGDIQLHLFKEHAHHPHFPHPAPGYVPPGIPLPHKLPIHGGMQIGRQAFISGTPTGNFEINLRCGMWDGGEVGFHFNVRFNENQVVRNSFIGGCWGGEERHGGFPFHRAPVTVQIIAEYGGFKVLVNGQYFADFAHRIQPVQRIDAIEVKGEISLTSCTV